MKSIKVDRTKLYTQTAYAKKINVTPPAVARMVKEGRVHVVEVNGGKLILSE